jgi:hypothetical protein
MAVAGAMHLAGPSPYRGCARRRGRCCAPTCSEHRCCDAAPEILPFRRRIVLRRLARRAAAFESEHSRSLRPDVRAAGKLRCILYFVFSACQCSEIGRAAFLDNRARDSVVTPPRAVPRWRHGQARNQTGGVGECRGQSWRASRRGGSGWRGCAGLIAVLAFVVAI